MSILKKSLAIGAAATIAALGASGASAAVDLGKISTKPNGQGGYNVSFASSQKGSFDVYYTIHLTVSGDTSVRTGISSGTLGSASFNGQALTLAGGGKTASYDFGFLKKGDYTFKISGLGGRSTRLSGSVSVLPAVPEPASWALLIGGVGVVGGAMRRRSTRTGGRQVLA